MLSYSKRRNIGSTFNLAIEHKIAKLKKKTKNANILVHTHNVIDAGWYIVIINFVQLAALLTQVYYSDKEANKVWPPLDYE